jgi:isoamylase
VILDVVYNHTAEGSHLGPTLSFRGIDNVSYYALEADRRYYVNHTGVGNSLNLAHPRVLQMVMDSLHYWVSEMHVDGFRFDLAATLGRTGNGFDPGSPFFAAIRQAPGLQHVKLIAEPWDVGPGGYQVGNFPPGWSQWNDRFRDAVRRFWRGDEGVLPELAGRLAGSADLFDRSGRRPRASLNFITSHDGFTLQDLVSYSAKHNEANLEDNRDGTPENHSANYGVEGPTDDPAIVAIREQQKRNLLATLFLAQGTLMMLAGDECGRTQGGNNNGYCQDNPLSWFDWSLVEDAGAPLITFVQRLAALRKAHPVLRHLRFLHGREVSIGGLKDIMWFGPHGGEMSPEDWHAPEGRCVGLLLNGFAAPEQSADGRRMVDDILLTLINAHDQPRAFVLPNLTALIGWQRILDTTQPDLDADPQQYAMGQPYELPARSLVQFKSGHRSGP